MRSAATKKVGLISLGCPKNRVDSEIILGNLITKGYEITEIEEEAEIIVVNTCGFLDAAKKESIETILEIARLKKEGNLKQLIVAGCLSQRYAEELRSQMPEVDFIMGVDGKEALNKIFSQEQKSPEKTIHTSRTSYRQKDFLTRKLTTPFYTAYVKIAEGCSNRCSFCIIPEIRGPFRSRPLNSILQEVRQLARKGVKEINLIAQDSTMYGIDLRIKEGLVTLLKELVKIRGIEWIRILYCYPTFLSDKLLDLMSEEEKICPYIDLPLQHSHSEILTAMYREEDETQIRNLVNKIRQKVPQAAIRTAFIVGFPGEKEKHFNHLYRFLKEMQFEHVGIFSYSPEENTPAAKFSHPVPANIKKERYKKLMELQQGISRKNNERMIGQIKPVLIEGITQKEDLLVTGRLATQAPDIDGLVYLDQSEALTGTIVPVRITRSMEYDLVGQIAED